MGANQSSTGPVKISNQDLETNEERTVYKDGDLVDQADSNYEPEAETLPGCYCVVPGIIFHAFNKGKHVPDPSSPGTVVSKSDMDMKGGFVLATFIGSDGRKLNNNDINVILAKNIRASARRMHLTDAKSDDARSKADFIDAEVLNYMINLPGSRAAFNANLRIFERIRKPTKKEGDVTADVITAMILSMLGQNPAAILLGTPQADAVMKDLGVANDAASLAKPLSTSRAAKKFSKRCWAIAKRSGSRMATAAACRDHTCGGFNIPVRDVLDSSRQVEELSRGQKTRDSIVQRSSMIKDLNCDVEAEKTAYYKLVKSSCCAVTVWLNQLAASYHSSSGSSDTSPIDSARASMNMTEKPANSSLYPRWGWSVLIQVDGVDLDFYTPFLAIPIDLSCPPRRAGGTTGSRKLVRSMEKLYRYAPVGLTLVTGTGIEASIVMGAGNAVYFAPQLYHPAVAAHLPASLKALHARAMSATVKRASDIITTITYHFELGRFGHDVMNKENLVRSEAKAIKKYAPLFGSAAEMYGKAYSAIPADAPVYKHLISASNAGFGALKHDSSEAEVKQALNSFMDKFTGTSGYTTEEKNDELVATGEVETSKDTADIDITFVSVKPEAAPKRSGVAASLGSFGGFLFGSTGAAEVHPITEYLGLSTEDAEECNRLQHIGLYREVYEACRAADDSALEEALKKVIESTGVATGAEVTFGTHLGPLLMAGESILKSIVPSSTVWAEAHKKIAEKAALVPPEAAAAGIMAIPEPERWESLVGSVINETATFTTKSAEFMKLLACYCIFTGGASAASEMNRKAMRTAAPKIKEALDLALDDVVKITEYDYK